MTKVPFFDLKASYLDQKAELDAATLKVLASGHWVGGPEVEAFEKAWAAYSGQAHAVGVGNGTDAITLALWALGVGDGAEVILPALSAYPSAVGVMRSGAAPVFCEVDERGLIDLKEAERLVTKRTRAIMPVHLYGNAADMGRLKKLADERALAVVEDCAQAHGVRHQGEAVGSWSGAAAWSFYPTKNLGAAGDAGAVTSGSAETAGKLRRLRNYGQKDRYEHVEPGINSRLDPLHALFLAEKLKRLEAKNTRRREIAARYDKALAGVPALRVLAAVPGDTVNRHLYPVFMASPDTREPFRAAMLERGIETLVHYPVAMPDQPATPSEYRMGQFSVARRLAATEVSLPVYPEMTDAAVDAVIAAALASAALL